MARHPFVRILVCALVLASAISSPARAQFTSFCFGDGSSIPCPCSNNGVTGHGCENSGTTGGAVLSAAGNPSLSADTLQLTSAGELPTSFSVVLQGASTLPVPIWFGDGLLCAGPWWKRLYVIGAVNGVVVAPVPNGVSISARSAALGDTLTQGATRNYQVFYRDPSPTFCIWPPGNTFNVSSAVAVLWGS